MKIALLDDYRGLGKAAADWDRLPPQAEVVSLSDHIYDRDALVRLLEGFGIIVAMRERTALTGDLLGRLPKLRLIVTTGMRNPAIDMQAAAGAGILVCGTDSLPTPAVELTWALILALARRLPDECESVRSGGWQTGAGVDLAGSTLGVIGLGRLGTRVAELGLAFGMQVIAWSRNLDPARAKEIGVEYACRDELLSRSDFVTLHLVLGERSRAIIGAPELSLMKRTAYLINTSRGPLVDHVALIEALDAGRLAGAGLDVFDREPLPASSVLRNHRAVISTPHIGVATRGNYRLFYGQALENIESFLAGRPLRVLNGRWPT